MATKIEPTNRDDILTSGKSRSAKKRRRHEYMLLIRPQIRHEKKIREKKMRLEKEKIETPSEAARVSERERRVSVRERCERGLVVGQRICVDLSMEDCMTPKEHGKLAQQLCRLYGSNRKSAHPAHVFLTGLKMNGSLHQTCIAKNQGFNSYLMTITETSHTDLFAQSETVYLTPDSPNILSSVDREKVYVLGGLVDKNIQKNETETRARDVGICTARLPIREYMKKTRSQSSCVLAINQVFDILLKYMETQDWTQALPVGVPLRKGYTVQQSKPSPNRTTPTTFCGGLSQIDSTIPQSEPSPNCTTPTTLCGGLSQIDSTIPQTEASSNCTAPTTLHGGLPQIDSTIPQTEASSNCITPTTLCGGLSQIDSTTPQSEPSSNCTTPTTLRGGLSHIDSTIPQTEPSSNCTTPTTSCGGFHVNSQNEQSF